MRLAVVSPFVDRRHGTERALAELLERLARKEHCEIHLYAQRVEGLALGWAPDASAQAAGTIIWHKVPAFPGPHVLQFLLWLLLNSLRRAWDRRVHGLRFDLVFSPGINCLDANVVIVHVLFHRLLEIAREEELEAAGPGLFRRLHRRAYYSVLAGLERRIYSDPNVSLATVSQRTATLLANYFHRQDVRIIPNGVDATRFSSPARLASRSQARLRRSFQESDFVLLLLGNDWRVKGLQTVLRAMSALRGLPLHIVVAGSDDPKAFMESAKKLGVLERCHFERPCDDVLHFYAAADLYVSPSREDSFGLPVAEAMACGLPVITSALAGVAELIQNRVNGFVLGDPRDVEELTLLLEELYRNREQRQHVGQAASEIALEWNWDRNALAIWELLKDVAARDCRSVP